jgi:hypothetical protein
MSTDNVTDRLLSDARRKAARQESVQEGARPGKIALIVGIIAVVVSPVSILGWIGGATALGLGARAVRHPAAAKQARIAMVLGFAAILVGVFFFTLSIASA